MIWTVEIYRDWLSLSVTPTTHCSFKADDLILHRLPVEY